MGKPYGSRGTGSLHRYCQTRLAFDGGQLDDYFGVAGRNIVRDPGVHLEQAGDGLRRGAIVDYVRVLAADGDGDRRYRLWELKQREQAIGSGRRGLPFARAV